MKALEKLTKLVEKEGYKIHYVNATTYSGKWVLSKKKLFISKLYPKYKQFCTILHELGHVYCHKNGIWKKYHRERRTKVDIKTALKAEVWVDKWAENKFKDLFPKGFKGKPYWNTYKFNKECKDYLREYYKGYY
jgi:hypothetical protein